MLLFTRPSASYKQWGNSHTIQLLSVLIPCLLDMMIKNVWSKHGNTLQMETTRWLPKVNSTSKRSKQLLMDPKASQSKCKVDQWLWRIWHYRNVSHFWTISLVDVKSVCMSPLIILFRMVKLVNKVPYTILGLIEINIRMLSTLFAQFFKTMTLIICFLYMDSEDKFLITRRGGLHIASLLMATFMLLKWVVLKASWMHIIIHWLKLNFTDQLISHRLLIS